MADDDTSAGRPRRITDSDIIRAVNTVLDETGDPVATTKEIEDRVALSRRGLQKRLRQLDEKSEIASKQVGARGRVWWIPD